MGIDSHCFEKELIKFQQIQKRYVRQLFRHTVTSTGTTRYFDTWTQNFIPVHTDTRNTDRFLLGLEYRNLKETHRREVDLFLEWNYCLKEAAIIFIHVADFSR